ncbi:MAG TPA: Maf family protein [Caulobacteraceae bacterium]|nr:Maf family protein [Caulobacteraceae bacterium]
MIILASASAVRAKVLEDAGVGFEVEVSRVDEGAVKAELAGATAHELAGALAARKALEVAGRRDGVVIGADQTLEFDGRAYDKANGMEQTRARLLAFRGRSFALHAGVALARGDTVLWTTTQTSTLQVRDFGEAWLDSYLKRNAGALAFSLAGFEMEGEGPQLFDAVEGDYFAILGLPLLPLLGALRQAKALEA